MSTLISLEMFAKTLQETSAWIEEYLETSGETDPHLALNALRATFHALRDELSIDQNAHLSAQLPTLLRGFYYEAWDPQGSYVRRGTLEAFLDRIADEYGRHTSDFDPADIATAVFSVMQNRIYDVCRKIQATLPRDYRVLWESDLAE